MKKTQCKYVVYIFYISKELYYFLYIIILINER
jgi:hypothetical protein